MAFDGIVASAVLRELKEKILGGKINNVTQPEKDELVLNVYSNRETFRLFLSANPENARINLTKINRENPMTAPNFCMMLRKHIVGAKITAIEQVKFDRIIVFTLEGMNDMGDPFTEKLIVEIMGRRSNIVLVNANGIIVDALKHIGSEINSFREVLPARVYVAPPAQEKLMPCEVTQPNGFCSAKEILDGVMGFSKPVAIAAFDKGILGELLEKIENGDFRPFVYGDFSDFHVLPEISDGKALEFFASVSEALEAFYKERDALARAKNLKASTEKTVTNNIERVTRKIEILRDDIKNSEAFDEYRIKGDLLSSCLHIVNQGDEAITCVNYYDPALCEITIALDPHKNGAWNLKNYYRLYRKFKSKFDNAGENLKKAEDELSYLLSVREALAVAGDTPVINEIKAELCAEGYVKAAPEKNKRRPPVIPAAGHIVAKTGDGYTVWIGRNNIQNDLITTKLSAPNDLWLHVKGNPGSHVILRTSETGGKYTQTSVIDAARLAAQHSSLRSSGRADVDFTYIKHVKKPSGARPGMVIFTNQKTITIDF